MTDQGRLEWSARLLREFVEAVETEWGITSDERENAEWLISRAEKFENEQTLRILHERKVRELEEENRVLLKQNNINYDRAVEYQEENERMRQALTQITTEVMGISGAYKIAHEALKGGDPE